MRLNVNIDHIATIRNARGGNEPDPVAGAIIAELAGAEGIVCHLREDRRHINDRDLAALREVVRTKLDLEMAANKEIIKIALKTLPELVTIVPEKRQELTTEGGLDVASDIERFKALSERMHEKGIEVSYFIEPDERQIDAVLEANGDMVEFHTGVYANIKNYKKRFDELTKLEESCEYAFDNDLNIAAGHGLDYFNVKQIAGILVIDELSIGHSIISKSVFVGLDRAVRDMIELIDNANINI
jgi:pyridoxine 5-phosphate synthase